MYLTTCEGTQTHINQITYANYKMESCIFNYQKYSHTTHVSVLLKRITKYLSLTTY